MSIKFLCVTLPHMSICARVIVSVPFHEVHNAPNAKARADGNNESLQNGNSLIEEFHSRFSPDCSIKKKHDSKRKTGWHIFGAACSCNSGFSFHFHKNQPFGIAKCRDQSGEFPATGSARTGGRAYLFRISTSYFLCGCFFGCWGQIHFIAVKFFIHPQP